MKPAAAKLPRVSVVIPAWNEERSIARTLRSLTEQTVQPYEIIVVNNNSTDKTADIARQFNIVRVIDEPRQGITYARNTGFDAASGDVIARTDADSFMHPNWIETITREFAADEELAGLAGGTVPSEINPPGFFSLRWYHRLFRAWHERSIGVRPVMYGCNSAIRRRAWNDIRDDTTLGDNRISEDVDVTVCLLKRGFKVKYRPDLLVRTPLWISLRPSKMRRYYATDGYTLAHHAFGNPKRRVVAAKTVDNPDAIP